MFGKMKVATRLGVAFGAVVVLLIAVIAVGATRLKAMHAGITDITQVNNEEIRAANAMNDAANDTLLSLEEAMLGADSQRLKTLDETHHEAVARFEKELTGLRKNFDTDATTTSTEKELVATVTSQWQISSSERSAVI